METLGKGGRRSVYRDRENNPKDRTGVIGSDWNRGEVPSDHGRLRFVTEGKLECGERLAPPAAVGLGRVSH
jgi:hypothetical protein